MANKNDKVIELFKSKFGNDAARIEYDDDPVSPSYVVTAPMAFIAGNRLKELGLNDAQLDKFEPEIGKYQWNLSTDEADKLQWRLASGHGAITEEIRAAFKGSERYACDKGVIISGVGNAAIPKVVLGIDREDIVSDEFKITLPESAILALMETSSLAIKYAAPRPTTNAKPLSISERAVNEIKKSISGAQVNYNVESLSYEVITAGLNNDDITKILADKFNTPLEKANKITAEKAIIDRTPGDKAMAERYGVNFKQKPDDIKKSAKIEVATYVEKLMEKSLREAVKAMSPGDQLAFAGAAISDKLKMKGEPLKLSFTGEMQWEVPSRLLESATLIMRRVGDSQRVEAFEPWVNSAKGKETIKEKFGPNVSVIKGGSGYIIRNLPAQKSAQELFPDGAELVKIAPMIKIEIPMHTAHHTFNLMEEIKR